ncbi:MAG: hypothetical protein AABZ12_11475 [Planctomycetota bacterium]
MSSNLRRIASVAVLVACGGACGHHSDYKSPAEMQFEKMEHRKTHAQGHLRDMTDNAMTFDMALVDAHFVPHTAELNATGTARLDRMAPILNTYGGTVRFDTVDRDQELVQKRMAHAKEYLQVAGCDVSRVDVKPMLPGGRGVLGEKGVAIDRAGTKKPSGGGAGPTTISLSPPPSAGGQ